MKTFFAREIELADPAILRQIYRLGTRHTVHLHLYLWVYVQHPRMVVPKYDAEPYLSVRRACETDNVQLLSRTFLDEGVTTKPPNDTTFALLHYACRQSVCHNSTLTLAYIISDRKFSAQNIGPSDILRARPLSTRTIDVLIAHGWDINARGPFLTGQSMKPFFWWVLSNDDMVSYCLAHGASVHPKGQSPLQPDTITRDQLRCPTVLEEAAAMATVATFDRLHALKAPLGWRPLHLAVQATTESLLNHQPGAANEARDDTGSNKARTYRERMAMVRHLVEDLGLDINAPDQPAGKTLPDRRGPPLCYVANSDIIEVDSRELTWFLLDHGADPQLALEHAERNQHPTFAADVEAWREQTRDKTGKSANVNRRKSSKCHIQ